MRTKEELKQVAIDIYKGLIFGSWNIKNPKDIPLVFMVCVLCEPDKLKDAAHVFEYLSKAGHISVNKMPTFLSVQILTNDEIDIIQPILKHLKEAEKSILL